MCQRDSQREELIIDVLTHFCILQERLVRTHGIDREVADLRMNLKEIAIEFREAGSRPSKGGNGRLGARAVSSPRGPKGPPAS